MALLGCEDKTGCRGLADADAQEVNLQTWLLLCDIRVDLKHVRLQDRSVVAIEVQRVVLQERGTAFQALAHEPGGAIETCTLPVALGTEAIAVVHQTLRGQAWDLVKATSCLFHVDIAQVIEVGGKALGAIGLQHGTERELSLGGVPDLLIFDTLLILQGVCDGILLEVDVVHEGIDIFVFHLVEILHDCRELHVVDMIAQYLLEGDLVTIGHGDLVHLVAEADDQAVLCIGNTGADTLPHSDVLECLLVFPVTDDGLAGLAQTGKDMSELTVAVSALVEVHEVHVDVVPWYLLIVLGMQVEKGFAKDLHALDPHLSGGEGMHPADHTDALAVYVGTGHDIGNLLGTVGRSCVYDLDRQQAGIVHALYHLFGVTVYLFDSIASVKELCTCDKPNLEIFKCFFHDDCLVDMFLI